MAPELGITLTRHIYEKQKDYPQATGELTGILNQIALAAKIISREVNKAGLVEILGLTGAKNIQGEEVRKLDQFSNEVFISTCEHSGHFAILASEENDDAIPIAENFKTGHYSLAFDPLDGSSNIDANIAVGSIFAVHRTVSKGEKGTVDDLLQPGRKLVAAGYVIYSGSTMMVYSTGQGVHGFTLDPSVGEFLLSHDDIRIPERGKIYSANEGNYPYWSEGVRRYIDHVKEKDPATKRPYSTRYVGSLVADVHRTLLYGGIFLYPADSKDPKKPGGKLRLLYECSPMAFLFEQAGGKASNGVKPILDIEPFDLHQRVPFIAGSAKDVTELEGFVSMYDKK